MEYEKLDDKTIEYIRDNEKYTLYDMGEYVGHHTREWYEEPYPNWFVVKWEQLNTNEPMKIDALISRDGYYFKVDVCKGDSKAVSFLNLSGKVEERVFFEGKNDGYKYASELKDDTIVPHFVKVSEELNRVVNEQELNKQKGL